MINIYGYMVNEIIFILGIELLGGLAFIIIWYFYNKDKFTSYICEPYLNTYKIKKKMKISMLNETFKFKDKAYKINFRYAISDDKNKPVLFYNILTANPILPLANMNINKNSKDVDAKTFKIGLDGDIMKHFASRRVEKMFLYVMLALVICVIIIGVYSIYSLNQNNAELIILSKKVLNITKSIRPPVVIP